MIRIDRGDFAAAVTWVSRAMASRPPAPVLAGVLMEADPKGAVTLSAFDYEVSSTTTVAAEVTQACRVLVSGPLLLAITRLLPSAPVTVATEDTRVVLTCGNMRVTLPTMPVEDYPQLPPPPAYVGEVDAKVFAEAVRQVTIAASTDYNPPALAGVLIEIRNGAPVCLVATDRYRLAVRDLAWQSTTDAPSELSAVVDAHALDAAAKQLASFEGTVRFAVELEGRVCGLSDGTRHTTLPVLDAEFPKFRQLLPKKFTAAADVVVEDLVAAVKRAAVFAERGSYVRLDFAPSNLQVTGGHEDIANGVAQLPIEFDGGEMGIAFAPERLLAALQATRTDRARLNLTEPHRPMVVQPLTPDGQPSSEYQHLIMPIRIDLATKGRAAA